MITANRRASATIAFYWPRRLAMFIAQAFSLTQSHFHRVHASVGGGGWLNRLAEQH
jgi:hypothetical protein